MRRRALFIFSLLALLLVGFVSAFPALWGQTSISGVVNRYSPVVRFVSSEMLAVKNGSLFSPGDRVLIIQMQGARIDVTNTPAYGQILDYKGAGLHEFARIEWISGEVVNLVDPLVQPFEVGGNIQMIYVPEYQSAVVAGTVTCPPWDGASGGVVVLQAETTLRLNADIDVSQKGFRGGISSGQTHFLGSHLGEYVGGINPDRYGMKGEGIAGFSNSGRGAPANGGGGGNQHNAGAGGGSNGGCGGRGGFAYVAPEYRGDPTITNGDGGHPLLSSDCRLFMGGGGGAGHGNDNGETDGAPGGGLVIVVADVLDGSGHFIRANGGNSQDADQDGCGGAGAGGTICLAAKSVPRPLFVEAIGGTGGNTLPPSITGPGGGGGGGVIRWAGPVLPSKVVVQSLRGGQGGLTAEDQHYGSTNGCDGVVEADFQFCYRKSFVVKIVPDRGAMCSGDSVRLLVEGGVRWRWTPTSYLSCADCANPTAFPPQTTSYNVTAWSAGGDSAFALVQVEVYPMLQVFAGEDQFICGEDSARLHVNGGVRHEWSPVEGLSCTDCADPTARPSATTEYVVTGWSSLGCEARDTVKVIVDSTFPFSAGEDQAICGEGSVQLHASGGVRWEWSPAEGLSCTDCADPTAHPSVTTEYVVTGWSSLGCEARDTVTVVVDSTFLFSAGEDQAICGEGSVQLHASGGVRWEWSPVEGLSCTDCADPTARPSATTEYVVTGWSLHGCSLRDTVQVIVHPLPQVEAGADVLICPDVRDVQLRAAGADFLRWDLSPDLSCLDCPDPIARPSETTTYYVTGTTTGGCTGRDSVRVVVLPKAIITAEADPTICAGDSVKLETTGGVRWEWGPPEGLSCTDCANPVASPRKTTTYVVKGWNADGCSGLDTVEVVVRTEPEVIRLRIGRNLHSAIGEPFVIPVEVVGDVSALDIREIEIELEYNPTLLLINTDSIEPLLSGTLLADWHADIKTNLPGRLVLILTAPAGRFLSGRGDLLRIEGRMYLTHVRGTELPFRVTSASRCFRIETEPGYAEVDSICGLSLRLIELSGAKYTAPMVWPNPAQDEITVEFGLGLDGMTELEVYDGEGRRVGLLLSEYLTPGFYRVMWDVRSVSSGVYWYRLRSGAWNVGGELRVAE